MSDTPNPPAFPSDHGAVRQGMHLRDYFAAQVILGLWSGPNMSGSYEELATIAYTQADAMLKQRAES